ncbi:MAG: prolyl oligopeptidase family serine peptidase [Taibaiella sp.]|nr:prolyl oligopeptidase family serine peptidase [Taibaiella sp.]
MFPAILLFSCNGKSGGPISAPLVTDVKIEIGIKKNIHSFVLNEDRQLWIYVPNSFNYSIYRGQKRYPVVYLLDGDVNFHSFTGIMEHLSNGNGNTICPDMLVVAILNTNRTRDLTPTRCPVEDSTSGGGARFIAFMERELIPYIDSLYHPLPFRMLVGHSYGGLTVVNALLHHPDSFNAFVAIDPSMAWDSQKLLRESSEILKTKDFKDRFLFIGMANTLTDDMDLRHLRSDTSAAHQHIKSLFSLVEKFRIIKNPSLKWDYNYYEDENHYSVPLRGEYDALHFIFREYDFTAYNELLEGNFSADSCLNMVLSHYRLVSQKLQCDLLPPEKLINAIGYAFLENHAADKAFVFFQWNITHYADGYNVYDSMGDYYSETGDNNIAELYYDKAILLESKLK